MKTVWIVKAAPSSPKLLCRTIAYRLFVDVIPPLLLVAAMACGMAIISASASVPGSAEQKVIVGD